MVGLSVEGHEDIFEVSPKIINRRGTFVISIKSNKKLDYEATKSFHLKVRYLRRHELQLVLIKGVKVTFEYGLGHSQRIGLESLDNLN